MTCVISQVTWGKEPSDYVDPRHGGRLICHRVAGLAFVKYGGHRGRRTSLNRRHTQFYFDRVAVNSPWTENSITLTLPVILVSESIVPSNFMVNGLPLYSDLNVQLTFLPLTFPVMLPVAASEVQAPDKSLSFCVKVQL